MGSAELSDGGVCPGTPPDEDQDRLLQRQSAKGEYDNLAFDFLGRKRTQVTLDDIARELNPITRGSIAYYGRYTRSALYPLARYIDQTLAVWTKRKFKRFYHRLGHARDFLAKIARENPRLFPLATWRKWRAGLMGAG